MENESAVDDLINQLETLQIEEARVLHRLVAAREHETQARATRSQGTCIERDIETEEAFIFGGRVERTNRIGVAFGRRANINDRRAIITKVSPTRINLRTVNRTNNWRKRTNLRIVGINEAWTPLTQ